LRALRLCGENIYQKPLLLLNPFGVLLLLVRFRFPPGWHPDLMLFDPFGVGYWYTRGYWCLTPSGSGTYTPGVIGVWPPRGRVLIKPAKRKCQNPLGV